MKIEKLEEKIGYYISSLYFIGLLIGLSYSIDLMYINGISELFIFSSIYLILSVLFGYFFTKKTILKLLIIYKKELVKNDTK